MPLNAPTVSGVKDVIARVIAKTMQFVTGQPEPVCVTVKAAGWEMSVTSVRHLNKYIKFSPNYSIPRNWVSGG